MSAEAALRRVVPLDERLWRRIDATVGPAACWPWGGARTAAGYGVLGRGRRGEGLAYAHRVAYESRRGPIPEGLQIDHLCRNRACCNPAHMEAVTQRVNIARGHGCSARYMRAEA